VRTFLQSNLIDAPLYSGESRKRADIILWCDEDYRTTFHAVRDALWETVVSCAGPQRGEREYTGLVVPVPAPFSHGNGIDTGALARHVAFLAAHGVRRILVNGTIGEFFSLTREQRRRIFIAARENFDGIIFFHAGCGCLQDTIDEALWGERQGADVVVCVAPYYFAAAPQQGIIEYFTAVSAGLRVPFMVYNFPRHTGNRLTPGILSEVRHFGIKDSSCAFELIAYTPRYYVGGDRVVVDAFAQGACGFVSSCGNVLPETAVGLENALSGNDGAKTRALQEKLAALDMLLSGVPRIAGIKYALSKIIESYPPSVRPPLVACDREAARRIDSFLDGAFEKNHA
jgi:4-hydroxy-tetrahydrodipicolinate synthase